MFANSQQVCYLNVLYQGPVTRGTKVVFSVTVPVKWAVWTHPARHPFDGYCDSDGDGTCKQTLKLIACGLNALAAEWNLTCPSNKLKLWICTTFKLQLKWITLFLISMSKRCLVQTRERVLAFKRYPHWQKKMRRRLKSGSQRIAQRNHSFASSASTTHPHLFPSDIVFAFVSMWT